MNLKGSIFCYGQRCTDGLEDILKKRLRLKKDKKDKDTTDIQWF